MSQCTHKVTGSDAIRLTAKQSHDKATTCDIIKHFVFEHAHTHTHAQTLSSKKVDTFLTKEKYSQKCLQQ